MGHLVKYKLSLIEEALFGVKLIAMSRASGVMDFIVIAMALLLPFLFFSIYQIRVNKNKRLHRHLQTVLGIILFLSVVVFEIDVRLSGWREAAEPSQYYDSWVFPLLWLHLLGAIPTFFLWVGALYQGLSSMTADVASDLKIKRHKRLGSLASYGLVYTAMTGWIFYIFAFVL